MSAQYAQNENNGTRRWYKLLKFACLSLGFFLIIASYTLARELKDSVFMAVVGKEYIPWAKMIALFVLIPAILLYSRLVDKLRRVQLLYFYTALYGSIGLAFALFLGHHSIGLPNTDTSPYRIFGWLFYLFVEGYAPFVVSVYWAFANSINNPKEAKNTYGIMIACSKLGGVVSALMALCFLHKIFHLSWFPYGDVTNHQALLAVGACILLLVPLVISFMIRVVPGYLLHGYEAVYKAEKQRAKSKTEPVEVKKTTKKPKAGLFDGLMMIIRYPYVTGIFAIICFNDIVSTVISYQRLSISKEISHSMTEVTAFLFQQAAGAQMIGIVIALVGTHTLLRIFGERKCLLMVPILMGAMLFFFIVNGSLGFVSPATAVMVVYMGMRSLHYAFSTPLRESLYIPTVKDVKFKSKSWIDTFGSKFAKAGGSAYNMITATLSGGLKISVNGGFFGVVIAMWVFVAYYMGRRFEQTVKNNEVIGQE
jgi:ATP:ADP antiporter, AAA family